MPEVVPSGGLAWRGIPTASQIPSGRAHALVAATFALSLVLVGGCGGGGGGGYSGGSSGGAYGGGGGGTGGGTGSTLMSAPGASAVAKYLQSQHETWLSAANSGNSYTLVVLDKPNAGSTTFSGAGPAYSTQATVTIAKNGDVYINNLVSTNYFALNPYLPLGEVYGSGTPYAVVNSSNPLPTTLLVGASGTVDSAYIYHDSTMATLDGEMTTSYAVRANNASTLLFCIDNVVEGATTQGTSDGLVDGGETDCYSVSAAGTVNLVSVTMTVNGITLNFH